MSKRKREFKIGQWTALPPLDGSPQGTEPIGRGTVTEVKDGTVTISFGPNLPKGVLREWRFVPRRPK